MSKMKKMWKKVIVSIVLILAVTLISNEPVGAKTVRKGGYYYTVAKKAETSEYGDGLYIKKVEISGNKITTYGNFSYGKKEWGGKKIKCEKRTFIISAKCSYWDDWGVPSGKKRMKKKDFIKILKTNSKLLDSPTCFIIQVKNGTVQKMMLGQA